MSDEDYICVLCDRLLPKEYMDIINKVNICFNCDECCLNFNKTIENEECPICYDNKILYELDCKHYICLTCFKKNYFGYSNDGTTDNIYYNFPDFPFNEDEYDNYEDMNKQYEYFEFKYFDIQNNTYEELINIRNSIICLRPEWMNTEQFIEYENKMFKWHKMCLEYEKNKIVGSKHCPLCRK